MRALLQQDSAIIPTIYEISGPDELRELVVNTIDEQAGDKLMTIAEQIERKVADKYEQQLAELARKNHLALQEKDQALQEKNQALQAQDKEKEALLKQLKEAGIEPKIQH